MSILISEIYFLAFGCLLFLIGVVGVVLNRKNLIIMLMSIELILLAVNVNFVVFSFWLDDITGQIFSIFILTVAAAESAIGLAILVIYHRLRGQILIEYINLIQG